MKISKAKAGITRLFGAMFATAAVATCAFAGTAFAAEGFPADKVEKIYDDLYALMATTTTGDDGGTVTVYNLIDMEYQVLYTTANNKEVTDYGIVVRDPDTGKSGLNTYTGKTLLEKKYDAIAYNDDLDNPTVFAAYSAKGKVVVEQYARGTSKAIDTLEIAIDDKDAKPTASIEERNEGSLSLVIEYESGEKTIKTTKMVSYTADGMTAVAIKELDGYQVYSAHAVTDGMGNDVFYEATYSTEANGEGTTTTRIYQLNGTEITELAGYEYMDNNADDANGIAADRFLFVKQEVTKDGEKVTNTKESAKVAGTDGGILTTIPEQSVDAYLESDWGLFNDYTFFHGVYFMETEEGDEYSTLLPCTLFNASGSSVATIDNVSSAYTITGAQDNARYLHVDAYTNFDDSVKSDSPSSSQKSRYSGHYETYYDVDLNEVPAHLIMGQEEGIEFGKPQAYMLDGTKLYTGAKFTYDQDDNLVQRANQYITSVYNSVHNRNQVRVGSADAFIGTTDNGKLGIVSGDGTQLAPSEYEGLYSQYDCNLAMVKKDGKWYFVDLTGRVRTEMFRLYNPNTGEHFYTSNAAERDNAVSAGWTYEEGKGWIAPCGSVKPVFRLYNEFGGEHHYTLSAKERDSLIEAGWTDEGVGWFSDTGSRDWVIGNPDPIGAAPLYREYNPNEFSCNHNYTADLVEHDGLIALGWINEGVAWYGLKTLDPINDANALPDAAEVPVENNDLTAGDLQ